MKFRVLRQNFVDLLDDVSKAVESKPSLPILACVLITTEGNRVKVESTDLEMSITGYIGAKVDEAGSCVVEIGNALKLLKTLKEEGHVGFAIEDDKVVLSCGATNARLDYFSSDEFPPIREQTEEMFQVKASELADAINYVFHSVSKNDNRPILTSIFLEVDADKEVLRFASADGYQLSVHEIPLISFDSRLNGESFTPKGESMRDLARLLKSLDQDDVVTVSRNRLDQPLGFKFTNREVNIVEIQGRYPDFSAIIPSKYKTELTMYSKDVEVALKRTAIFARDTADSIQIEYPNPTANRECNVMIIGKSAERGDAEVNLSASGYGENGRTSLNYRYVLDSIKTINSDRTQFKLNGAENPIVIQPEGKEHPLFVIMPMSR